MASLYTPRQGQYLAYIDAYMRKRQKPPSEAEIASHFDVSAPTAHQMVLMLESRGLIERIPGQARSIRIMVPQEDLPGSQVATLPTPPQRVTFTETYPEIADWVMHGGWVELGYSGGTRSMARAMDEGGAAWEGKERYRDVEELLRDLNKGIKQWNDVNT